MLVLFKCVLALRACAVHCCTKKSALLAVIEETWGDLLFKGGGGILRLPLGDSKFSFVNQKTNLTKSRFNEMELLRA